MISVSIEVPIDLRFWMALICFTIEMFGNISVNSRGGVAKILIQLINANQKNWLMKSLSWKQTCYGPQYDDIRHIATVWRFHIVASLYRRSFYLFWSIPSGDFTLFFLTRCRSYIFRISMSQLFIDVICKCNKSSSTQNTISEFRLKQFWIESYCN